MTRSRNGNTADQPIEPVVESKCRRTKKGTRETIGKAYPLLASQAMDPSTLLLTGGSNIKVWWRCEKKHEWIATVANRAMRKSGCPYCSGRRAIPGETDLATLRPDLAKQLVSADPTTLTIYSSKKVEWKCKKKHKWTSTVTNRVRLNSGCPYCGRKRVLIGETDLNTLYPEVAKELVNASYGELNPCNGRKVWWRCSKCSDEYRMSIVTRVKGKGCTLCNKAGYKTGIPGYLYLLRKTSETGEQRKIGITNNLEERVKVLTRQGWERIEVSPPMDALSAREIEQWLLFVIRNNGVEMGKHVKGENFRGVTESWHYADYPIDSLAEVFSIVSFKEICYV